MLFRSEAASQVVLTLTDKSITKVGSGSSGYAPYNGSREIDGYTVTTNQVMANAGKIQAQKSAGTITVTGSFSKVVITLDSETGKEFTLKAGDTPIVATKEGAVLTFDLGTATNQEIVISAGSGATYAVTIEFYS